VLVEPIDELLHGADLSDALVDGLLVMAWDPVAADDCPAAAVPVPDAVDGAIADLRWTLHK
jgi:hypothetical protein